MNLFECRNAIMKILREEGHTTVSSLAKGAVERSLRRLAFSQLHQRKKGNRKISIG